MPGTNPRVSSTLCTSGAIQGILPPNGFLPAAEGRGEAEVDDPGTLQRVAAVHVQELEPG